MKESPSKDLECQNIFNGFCYVLNEDWGELTVEQVLIPCPVFPFLCLPGLILCQCSLEIMDLLHYWSLLLKFSQGFLVPGRLSFESLLHFHNFLLKVLFLDLFDSSSSLKSWEIFPASQFAKAWAFFFSMTSNWLFYLDLSPHTVFVDENAVWQFNFWKWKIFLIFEWFLCQLFIFCLNLLQGIFFRFSVSFKSLSFSNSRKSTFLLSCSSSSNLCDFWYSHHHLF